MPQAVFEILSPAVLFDKFPLHIHQRTSRISAVLALFLLVPAVAAVLVPLLVFAANAAQQPGLMQAILAKPMAGLQVIAGILMWSAVIILPLKSLMGRLGHNRIVRISETLVEVEEKRLFRTTTWSQPLTAFQGIVHDVRTTLSGSRHELTLVHKEKNKSLLLLTAPTIDRADIERAANLLGLPQLQARDLAFSLSRRLPASASALSTPVIETS